MDRESLERLICKKVYKTQYNPIKIDWNELQYAYNHEPGIKEKKLKNESKVQFCEQELVLIENKIAFLEETLTQLQTEHEKWYMENDVLYRYRDSKSIEGTKLMEGPEGDCIEEWVQYFYNCLIQYRQELCAELGKAAKGDNGEHNVASVLAKSEFDIYTVHNVVLDVSIDEEKTNEIDTYVITPKGLFVLEVKNYGKAGTTLKITDTDKWDLVDNESGRVIKQEKNPQYQNARHAKATAMKVKELFGKEVPIFPLIVIGNNKVKLDFQSEMPVKNIDNFMSYIKNIKSDEVLTSEDMFNLRRMLEQTDRGSNDFSTKSYREQVYYMMDIMEKIFPFVAYNQDAKIFYYNMEKNISKLAVAAVVIILLGLVLITRNIELFMIGFFAICGIVAVGFFAFTAYQKGKDFMKNIGGHR